MRTRPFATLTVLLAVLLAGLATLQEPALAGPNVRAGVTAGVTAGRPPSGRAATGVLAADLAGHSARLRAERTLARAEAIVAPAPSFGVRTSTPVVDGGDATMVLRNLARRVDDLSPADQRTAHRILARPTGGTDPTGGIERRYTATPTYQCNANFCLHWVAKKGNRDYVSPSWEKQYVATFNRVWRKEIDDYGYQPPLSDAARGTDQASPHQGIASGDTADLPKLDIYLEKLPRGYFGYCTTDDPDFNPRATFQRVSAYCVLDSRFARSEFGAKPVNSLRVTAAHEFFHAVQFHLNIDQDTWFMEGTATWMEDQVFDAINDNFRYLGQSPLSQPRVPVDYNSAYYLPYGSWVYWKFLSDSAAPGRKRSDPNMIRQVWDEAGNPGVDSTDAVRRVLDARGSSFRRSFRQFGVWNEAPAAFYSEGGHYPTAPATRTFALTRSRPATGSHKASLQHLSTTFVHYTPGKGLTGPRRLRVAVNMPSTSRGAGAALTVHLRHGGVRVHSLRLTRSGRGSGTVLFSRSRVRSVVLSLSNAGIDYSCGHGTALTCEGRSLDNDEVTHYRARAIR